MIINDNKLSLAAPPRGLRSWLCIRHLCTYSDAKRQLASDNEWLWQLTISLRQSDEIIERGSSTSGYKTASDYLAGARFCRPSRVELCLRPSRIDSFVG